MAKKKSKSTESTGMQRRCGKPVEGGWKNREITGGFGRKDRSRQYRAKAGRTDLIRIVDPVPTEYYVHAVDDVAKDKEGNEITFNMICALKWNPEDEEWVGDCAACEGEYERSKRYATRILHLATREAGGTKWRMLDVDESPKQWDFGGDKYRALSDLAFQLSEAEDPKDLHQVELIIDCDDTDFQKTRISLSLTKAMTTAEHVQAMKANANAVEELISADPYEQQKKNLKPRGGPKKGGKKKGGKKEEEEVGDEPDEEESEAGLTGDPELDDILSTL